MGLRLKEMLALSFLFGLFMVIVQSVVIRQAQAEEGSLEAHVHGMSDLTIAVEGGEIEIEFESPAMNIVGFEYKAQSARDIEAAERAAVVLEQHDKVFTFIGTTCELIDSSVDVSGVLNVAHDDHDTHDDHDAHDGSESDAHSDISAAYHFSCDDALKLSAIQFHLFELFEGIEEIRTMWLREGKQGAITLTPKASRVDIQ
ncbi:MAG: DUF2796 domain-containing protein [Proteobacteria bacterium]|nr:DUF2796 domain-containing protein [Pseudomonadota bacterium]MDA0862977.1 DUF2796 domain-containing protein [Pseudomonadota bacterium]MDA1031195.1 DUF2796 domain-containing protein [Pseudomonadota bacterium]